MKLNERSVLEIEDSGDDDENDFLSWLLVCCYTVFVIFACLNWHGLRPCTDLALSSVRGNSVAIVWLVHRI